MGAYQTTWHSHTRKSFVVDRIFSIASVQAGAVFTIGVLTGETAYYAQIMHCVFLFAQTYVIVKPSFSSLIRRGVKFSTDPAAC